MRTMLLGLALLFSAVALQGQAQDIQEVKSRLTQYFKATEDKDWNTVVDYLYPKLFEQVSKADMIQMFSDMSGNGMEIQMSGYRIKRISTPFSFEDEKYTKVNYMGIMSLKLTSEAHQTPEMTGMVKGNLEGTYGIDAVTYDKTQHQFTVQVDNLLFAIADTDSSNWHFIESDGQNPMVNQLIPAEVRSHFEGQ